MLKLKQSGIKELEAIAQTTEGCISLAQGLLKAGGIPKEIKTHIQEVLNTDGADYYETASVTKLFKEKLAAMLLKKYNTVIPTEQIAITHGCMGGISTLLLSVLDAGEEVILPEPTYPVYENIVKTAKGIPVHVSCLTKEGALDYKYSLDIEKIKAATTSKTRAILFSNPSNPMGYMAQKEKLVELINWCEGKGIYLVIDEVYSDYVFNGEFHSVVPFIPETKFLVRASSFSKNFAMSGWRVGYIILPKHVVPTFDIAQHALIIAPSMVGQFAAIYALDNLHIQDRLYALIKSNLELTDNMLKPLKEQGIIGYNMPDAGFFFFIRTHEKDATELCMNLIKDAHVTLVPGEKFGPSGSEFLRICFARSPQVLQEALTRLTNYFNSQSHKTHEHTQAI